MLLAKLEFFIGVYKSLSHTNNQTQDIKLRYQISDGYTIYMFINKIKKRKLAEKTPQANDIIFAGDIKVDRGTLLANRLHATIKGG